MTILKTTYIIITVIVVTFQFSLAFGAPFGEYTLGGKYKGKLPNKMRFAPIIQGFILILFASIVFSKDNIKSSLYDFSSKGIWIVVVFFIIGSILNLITPSKKERLVWAPVNIILLIISLLIALN